MNEEEGVALGDAPALRTRGTWRRSTVNADDGRVYVGSYGGRVRALTGEVDVVWTADVGGMAVTSSLTDDHLVVGCRGEDGAVTCLDRESGDVIWRYSCRDDVGEASKDSLFYLPFVVDVEAIGDRTYAAVRRYTRDGDDRSFHSMVYCFTVEGEAVWRRSTDASPVAVDVSSERLAVAFNRCPGEDVDGVVVYDGDSGSRVLAWNPQGDGERRVGDVSLAAGGFHAASHVDHRGYRVDLDGDVSWRVDLGCPLEDAGDTVYSYPTLARELDRGALYATGNTFPVDGRDTDGRHPGEHTLTRVDGDGVVVWSRQLPGWIPDVEVAGGRVYAASAQHFRDPSPDSHGVHVFDVEEGYIESISTDGVPTALAGDRGRLYVVEEPVEYHDGEEVHGVYGLRSLAVDGSTP